MIATTREQSERLLRCGVPAGTADMMYFEDGELSTLPYSEYNEEFHHKETAPAWSLSRLLDLLPDTITYGGYKWGIIMVKLSKDCVCISYARWDNFNSTIGHLSGNATESFVKTIEWLTTNDYKLNEK